jgi:hypothetical protein
MDRLMVAATIPTKFVILFSSLLLFSCQNKIIVAENNLIDGMEISRYVRVTEFSGTITTTYNDGTTLKSKRKYKKGKKMAIIKDGGKMVTKNIVFNLGVI